jgi:hypothetical protein
MTARTAVATLDMAELLVATESATNLPYFTATSLVTENSLLLLTKTP